MKIRKHILALYITCTGSSRTNHFRGVIRNVLLSTTITAAVSLRDGDWVSTLWIIVTSTHFTDVLLLYELLSMHFALWWTVTLYYILPFCASGICVFVVLMLLHVYCMYVLHVFLFFIRRGLTNVSTPHLYCFGTECCSILVVTGPRFSPVWGLK